MWVNKDDMFTDDKIQEFKSLNPNSETHIRTASSTESPHSSAPSCSHLLLQHANSYMSSDGHPDLAFEYPPEHILTPPVPFSQLSSSTLTPSNLLTPLLPSLVLDLSLCPPQPRTLQPCSDSSRSPLQLGSPQMDSMLLSKPLKHLIFHSPLPKGKAMRQVQAWHCEQLLDLRQLWELHRKRQMDAGLIPMTHPPTMISDIALVVENSENTATDTLPSSLTPASIPN
jgi:hypothetical protein